MRTLNEEIDVAIKEAKEYYQKITVPLQKRLDEANEFLKQFEHITTAFYTSFTNSDSWEYRTPVRTYVRTGRITLESILDGKEEDDTRNIINAMCDCLTNQLKSMITKNRTLKIREEFKIETYKDTTTMDRIYSLSCRVCSVVDIQTLDLEEIIMKVLEEQPVDIKRYTKGEGQKN